MSDTPPNPLEGLLSNFALGPSWARAKSEPIAKKFKDSAEREFKPRQGDARRDDRRGGQESRGRQSGGRRDFERTDRPDVHREEIAPAEGVTVTLLPETTAIHLIIKEIQHVARVYPLFDIAQIILAERSRCRAVFEASEKSAPLLKCKFEEAIFLTKEEALRHLLESPWRNRYIEETTFEIDPPKGNFQSVARCGLSGEWLGPPNFHSYQTEIRRIHRERFPNMRFESYVAKIRTERGEEAVNSWLDTMKTQIRWRILSDGELPAVAADLIRQAPPTEIAITEQAPPEPIEEPEPSTDAATETVDELTEATDETPSPAEEIPAPAAEPTPDHKWFTDRAEFERALAAEVIDKAFKTTRKADVSAAIPGKNLSPGLLVRLKGTGSHHRKHPAVFIPLVCKILETEHMPVFKRKGKLYTGPARPHALAADAVLAPRPAEMVKWIRENTSAKLEGLWKAVLPEGATAPPGEYAADLFWLLQQGHILLYADDTLVVQEAPKPPEPKKPKKPKEKKPPVAATERSEMAGQDQSQTSPANSIRPAKDQPSPATPDSTTESASEETLPSSTDAVSDTSPPSSASEAPPAEAVSEEPSPAPPEASSAELEPEKSEPAAEEPETNLPEKS